ncbi:Na+/H+ antiporter [Longispora albida]|uniref:Na+/H+ antiporter n=1 Tax=Longispora albida TaxID=203523 RepID=UPI000362E53D|nr:Na+/H+ antiporter [Longispora albida]
MHELVTIVGLVATVVAVAALARRLGVLAPILLLTVGIGISYIPGVLDVRLSSEVVLVGILPPLLYVAAVETSLPAFLRNIRPILMLAVGHALFIAAAVGFTLHWIVPSVPLAAAFALGAVVAPPDAVAATSIASRIGLPRRMVTILEGESLVNDATALVTLRVAVAAATGQALSGLDITRTAAIAVLGGLAVGFAGAAVIGFLHRRTTNPLLDNSLSLLTPFLVFIPAEQIHASGVVAVVVSGLVLGHQWPTLMSAASRLQMEAFWKMVRFLLEGSVFLLVGLQIRWIIADLDMDVATVARATVAVVAVVIIGRFLWVYLGTALTSLLPGHRPRDPIPAKSFQAVVSWAGMRGVVTLAAASTITLAERPLLVWLAFAVIVATLLIQGLTLPWVVRTMKLPRDDPRADALAEAGVQHEAGKAGLDRLYELADSAPVTVVEQLRKVVDYRTNIAWERLGKQDGETPTQAYSRLRREMLEAEREVFRVARNTGRLPEEVLRAAQRDMDLEESLLERRHDE